jgi:hypothetical protein
MRTAWNGELVFEHVGEHLLDLANRPSADLPLSLAHGPEDEAMYDADPDRDNGDEPPEGHAGRAHEEGHAEDEKEAHAAEPQFDVFDEGGGEAVEHERASRLLR